MSAPVTLDDRLETLAKGEPSIDIKRAIADAVLPAELLGSYAGLVLPQDANDLLFVESAFPHRLSPRLENRLTSNRGLFRGARHLEQFETQCRLTGVTDAQHLRASHIKPWRVSDTYEKLDGNNGLLLSPHVDHLFDRGYISFSDEGGVMISPRCDESILESWQINRSTVRGTFRKEQLPYLEYHREFVFKK